MAPSANHLITADFTMFLSRAASTNVASASCSASTAKRSRNSRSLASSFWVRMQPDSLSFTARCQPSATAAFMPSPVVKEQPLRHGQQVKAQPSLAERRRGCGTCRHRHHFVPASPVRRLAFSVNAAQEAGLLSAVPTIPCGPSSKQEAHGRTATASCSCNALLPA